MLYAILREIFDHIPKGSSANTKILTDSAPMQGCNERINEIRAQEYPHLNGRVYLDNAGLPVCAKSVLEKSNLVLLQSVYGNPHSQSSVSQNTEQLIEQARLEVLKLFNLDYMTYEVVFTQNSTHAIKLLGEGFRDTFHNFNYLYNKNSHTSILGIREQASHYDTFHTPSDEYADLDESLPTLVAWLGQSNFNGQRFPIEEWNSIFKSKSQSTYTLLDASSLCSSAPPDFGNMDSVPDFICLSLYKIFGYPDLGCLIINKQAGEKVFAGKRYFGGGTVDAVTDTGYFERKVNLSSVLEEGTLPIHSIIQLSLAMAAFYEIYGSFKQISSHMNALTNYTINKFKRMSHDNDERMVEVFSCSDMSQQGPIVSFCLLDRLGNRLGYYDFEKYISARGVSLRTGALCNFGAMSEALNLTPDDITCAFESGHRCGDGQDMINGKLNGVIRISFGAMSNLEDVDFVCSCIEDYFAESFFSGFSNALSSDLTVRSITVYPIKSCFGYSIPANKPWKIVPNGLEYDRILCLLNPSTKSPLLLKNNPKMTMIRPKIDAIKKTMCLTYMNKSIEISLLRDIGDTYETVMVDDLQNGISYECIVEKSIKLFFEDVLSVPCLLAKPVTQSLHNKSDFLLISNSSIRYLENFDKTQMMDESTSSRFRGNLVVQGKDLKPFEEDNWQYIKLNNLVLKNTELCERCHMITIDPKSGKRDGKAFVNLSKFRKLNGKILFGINCDIDESCKSEFGNMSLMVGDSISIT